MEAVNRVQIVARVKGYLEDVRFTEGDVVKEGAPLYRIEKGCSKPRSNRRKGRWSAARPPVLTALELDRAETLLKSKSGTEVARDQARAADQGQRHILTDEANLKTAQINLGYTDITSPIAGRIGRTNVTKGNTVGPDSGVLALIVSQDPMYVTFPVSQRELMEAEKRGQTTDVKDIKVSIRFSDGSGYDQIGKINFVDVTVDRSTDTVIVRATMPNPKGTLIDGQLVRVTLESGTPDEKIVVPQAALLADQQGVYVFVVEDGKAAVKRVKPGAESGTNIVIDQGLAGGEQVIVEGLQNIRPGVAVRAAPMPAMIGRS